MSNIGLSTDLVLANTSIRPGTLVLPLSTQIPGRTITIKDATGACAVSTCFISTTGGDTFEDGATTKSLTTPYGFMKVTARGGKWFTGETTQPNYYTASTIRTTISEATSISTATMNVSSFSLLTDPVTPFTPRSIPGCVLWLDGKDVNGTGINITAGTTMNSWTDKSGNGNSTTSKAGTITMTANAIGNNAAPYFPKTPSYFLGSLPTYTGTAIYHFAVATLTTNAAAYGSILGLARTGVNDFADPTTEFAFIRNNATQGLIIGRNSSYLSTSIPAYATPFIVQSSQNGSTESIGVNGTFTPATQNTGISTGFNISAYGIGTNPATSDAGSWYDGVIAEVVVYMGTVLTTAQIQSVEGYLAQKWGLTSLLPVGHPGIRTSYYKTNDYVAPSIQSFYVSSSLAYWGPYLLNSGFRTAQPQIFFAIAKLMSQVYTLSTYSLANIENSVSAGSSTPVYIWSVNIPSGAKGKNAILTLFFNLYSATQFTANQYFDYGIYIDGTAQLKGDVTTIRYVQTGSGNYALSSGGIILGLNGMLSAYPMFIPLSISPTATQIQIGIANSIKAMSPVLSVIPGYTSNVTTSSGSSNTSGFIPQNTFTTTGNFTYTVPTNTSAGVPSGVFIYLWGGGGQSYTSLTGSYGGTGGFVSGYYACAGGTALNVVVGQIGGQTATTGGGGNQFSGNPRGGGYSGVFLGSVSQSNAIAIAGGGGGASETTSQSGGFGGYPTGGFPWSIGGASNWTSPGPGTQSAGGVLGTSFSGNENGTAGLPLIGGFGGYGPRGGGGGGGYWGGGGAGSSRGGGGGSSYIGGLTLATYSNGISYTQSSALPSAVLPGGSSNIYYVSGYGHADGGTGLAVIIPAIGANPVQVGVSATLFSA